MYHFGLLVLILPLIIRFIIGDRKWLQIKDDISRLEIHTATSLSLGYTIIVTEDVLLIFINNRLVSILNPIIICDVITVLLIWFEWPLLTIVHN